MITVAERLRAAAPTARFFPPATDAQIAEAESRLVFPFPMWLRQLYRASNGVLPEGGGGPYLYALDQGEDFPYGLVDWNQFHREQWTSFLPDLKRLRSETDWERLDPHQLLIIGSDEGIDWAIQPDGGRAILTYDVRYPDDREVIAADLVEACVRRERSGHEVEEQLFRGRVQYRDQCGTAPPACDVDRLFDLFVALHRSPDLPATARIGMGTLDRATSQQPGEAGHLYVLRIGLSDEIRIVTADGNLPFVMRLNAWPYGRTFSATVRTLANAMLRILATIQAVQLPWLDGQRPCPDESSLAQIWRADAWGSLPDLDTMADVLCARDDRRRTEPNDLG